MAKNNIKNNIKVKINNVNPNRKFSNIFKEERIKRKLSYKDVENISKIHHNYLWMIENGKRGIPTIKIIMKIEKGLGIKCGVLVMKAVGLLKGNI